LTNAAFLTEVLNPPPTTDACGAPPSSLTTSISAFACGSADAPIMQPRTSTVKSFAASIARVAIRS
jgi:hypothetical protein